MKFRKKKKKPQTWHQKHIQKLTLGQKIADQVAGGLGSWKFIIFQTVLVAFWVSANLCGFFFHWDAFPFILLNLLFSVQAAYTAPIIMMAQNRQAERDRVHAEADFITNVQAKEEIEEIQQALKELKNQDLAKMSAQMEEIKSLIKK